MNNFKLTVAYDGSRYNGWQRQGNTENTIQGKIEDVLGRLFGHKIEIHGSGRTDAGVHAKGQVASFKAETDLTAGEIKEYLNRYLPEDIAVISAENADPRFHARLNAKRKTYEYRIWNNEYPNVFERKYMYSVSQKIDTEKMREGARLLLGEHDFIGYSSVKKSKKSTVRCIDSIEITENNGEILMRFSGNGFLYNMVRIISGTLLETGFGKRSPAQCAVPLKTLDRKDAGETLPPKGLTLLQVEY